MSDIYEVRSRRLFKYMIEEGFKGYDPYDCLNSPQISKLKNRYMKILFTQFFVYSPLNLRKTFSIEKGMNPKGASIALRSFIKLKEMGIPLDLIDEHIEYLYTWLIENHNKDYSGMCWGYNFPWEDIHKSIPKYAPSIVVTSFIGHAIMDRGEQTKEDCTKEHVKSIMDFILNDINMNEDGDGICFSYSPFDDTMTHNANLLGSSLIARAGKYLGKQEYIDIAKKGYSFTLEKQSENGSWPYSIPKKGENQKAGNQIDYHQGFIIDCLLDHIEYIGNNGNIDRKIGLALDMYEKLFNKNGRSYWRYPIKWPTDIHSQAQGIITFTRSSSRDQRYLRKAQIIADWTLQNMTNDHIDHFYYQKWPLLTNQISYLRWNQAWMLYALTILLSQRQGDNSDAKTS